MTAKTLFRFLIGFALCYCALSLAIPSTKVKRKAVVNCDDISSIYVTVVVNALATSNGGNITERLLELWWDTPDTPLTGDWVGLFNKDPNDDSTNPLASVPANMYGKYTTNIQFPHSDSDNVSYEERCLGYWAAYIRGNTVLVSQCLGTQPTWMSDLRSYIGDVVMEDIFIPGAHDSGSYKDYQGALSNTLISKYSVTQDEDILHQLIYGVRYLDIRVAYYERLATQYWVNHGIRRMHPFQDVVNQVKQFLNNTNEIVIFDIHEFVYGFNDADDHQKFQNYLYQEFADYLTPKSLGWSATLEQIWSSGKTLIVTYNNAQYESSSPYYWQAVHHEWANVDTVNGLESYLNNVMIEAQTYNGPLPWSAMTELTPSVIDVIADRLGGLREAANNVNRNASDWFRDSWWSVTNIDAVDFLLSSDVVNIALQSNKKKLVCKNTEDVKFSNRVRNARNRKRVNNVCNNGGNSDRRNGSSWLIALKCLLNLK